MTESNTPALIEQSYPELALHPRSLAGVRYPHPSLDDTYQPGCTEPWVAQLVSSFLIASGGWEVLETGGFQGTTSAWLALALESMGGGMLTVAEIDPPRAAVIRGRLDRLCLNETNHAVLDGDALLVIDQFATTSIDFAWIDDDHTKAHVRAEINALWPKMRKGGLMVFHDVHGSVDLQEVVREYGGYAIDLPRLGPAGGLGVIQKQ